MDDHPELDLETGINRWAPTTDYPPESLVAAVFFVAAMLVGLGLAGWSLWP